MPAEDTASVTQTCPHCGATIDTTSAPPLARIPCPQCGEKVRVERAFNNFTIVETLGVGGMGTVYKAQDTQLDRFVALKLLRADLGGEVDHSARLQREARVAASINHPNVIQVFSSGTDHGQFYLVMELVERGSLDDWIEERKRLPEALVLQVGIQIAKGLRAAHAKGLIHRDIKPANILFADEQTAKIGDFGLAGVAAEKAEGEIWGTPYYVAPERLKSEAEDFRSDIYSLGATLFHAIAGTAPIQGETNSATALYQMKSQPLDLRKILPEISPGTASVLARMIALDRDKRFGSYDELVKALEEAQREFSGEDTGRGGGRMRWVWLGAAVLCLAAVAAFFFLQWKRQAQVNASKTAAAPAGMPITEIERQYNDARKQLLTGKHNVAHAAFARLASEARNHQPLYDWIRLHEALAALVGRDQSQARQAFQEVENAGERGFGKDDIEQARFFVAVAKLSAKPGSVPADQALFRADNYEAFGLLVLALKDIGFLDVNDAIGLLERFASGHLNEKYSWMGEYRPLAQKYLDDCRVYLTWKNSAPNDAAAASAARDKLKMTSAISDNLRAAEKKLEKSAGPAATAVAAASPTASVPAIDRAKLVAEWRRKLIDDLNRVHFNGRVVGPTGIEYSGIMGASEQGLRMKLPYGEAQLPWANLSPPTLLAVSKSFITAGAPDAADRQWLCAAYAAATQQADAAKQLAESAATAKQHYRDQVPQLLGGR